MAKVVAIQPEKAPAALSAESRRLWEEIVSDFQFDDAAGLAILRQLCESLDRLRQVQRAIADDGLVTKGYNDQPRAHPLLKVESETRRQVLACFRALKLDHVPEGLT